MYGCRSRQLRASSLSRDLLHGMLVSQLATWAVVLYVSPRASPGLALRIEAGSLRARLGSNSAHCVGRRAMGFNSAHLGSTMHVCVVDGWWAYNTGTGLYFAENANVRRVPSAADSRTFPSWVSCAMLTSPVSTSTSLALSRWPTSTPSKSSSATTWCAATCGWRRV